MNAPADDAAAAVTHAPSKSPKPIKEGKQGKKSKDDGAADAKAAAQLRRLADDLQAVTQGLSRLRADVDQLRLAADTPEAAGGRPARPARRSQTTAQAEKQILSALSGRADVLVALAAGGDESGADAPAVRIAGKEEVKAADTARVARVGYAFSSTPKVALLRLLLEVGEQSAAQLGEGAGLTTGSLYHHLRELVHSEVISPSGRNKYALTPLGRLAILAMLALATA